LLSAINEIVQEDVLFQSGLQVFATFDRGGAVLISGHLFIEVDGLGLSFGCQYESILPQNLGLGFLMFALRDEVDGEFGSPVRLQQERALSRKTKGQDTWVALCHDNLRQLIYHSVLNQDVVRSEKVDPFRRNHDNVVFRFQFGVELLDYLGKDDFRIFVGFERVCYQDGILVRVLGAFFPQAEEIKVFPFNSFIHHSNPACKSLLFQRLQPCRPRHPLRHYQCRHFLRLLYRESFDL